MLSNRDRLELVRLATSRVATEVHRQMSRGVNGLATVASIAPFVGMFGTVIGIASSFRGANGDGSSVVAALADSLGDAWSPTVLALFVAIPSMWAYRYLRTRIEVFDIEMEAASLDLLNRLSALSNSPGR